MNWMKKWAGAFPIFVKSANGAHFIDVDGRDYIDLCLGDTAAMTGHSPAIVAEAVARRAREGITFMLPTEDALWVGEDLQRRFGLLYWQFTLTARRAPPSSPTKRTPSVAAPAVAPPHGNSIPTCSFLAKPSAAAFLAPPTVAAKKSPSASPPASISKTVMSAASAARSPATRSRSPPCGPRSNTCLLPPHLNA